MDFTDDKVDNQSDDSAASADSGVILNDRLMSDRKRCNIDINTSIKCDTNDSEPHNSPTINIENIINLAKNVSPTKKGSPKKATPSRRSSSPTSSIRSTCISITSIHSDAMSSVIDSDCEVGDFEDSTGPYIIKKLGHQTSCLPGDGSDFPNIGGGDGLVLLQQRVDGENGLDALAMGSTSLSSAGPQIGNMAFTNSTDITIGQKNYYQGPVTIQQFLIENRNREAAGCDGNDNPAFQNVNGSPMTTARKMSGNHNDSKDANSSPYQPYKFMFNRRAVLITAVIITLTIVIGGIFATSSSMIKRSSKQDEDDEENRKHIPVNTSIGKDNFGAGTVLRMVPRDEWLARPEKGILDRLKLPVHRVIIAHTATENCTSQSECAFRTQIIQQFHMDSRNFDDIAYNFLVGGDGAVYEGRGWDNQGAHTKGFNVDSICVAFIGTFETVKPPDGQLNAAKLIINEGVKLNKIVPDYRLYGARQLMGTQSPGFAAYEIIKTWPNWSDKF